MTQEETIRRATVDDIPAINNLLAQVLSVHHQARPDLFKPTGNKFSDEELALLLKDDQKPVFVYIYEGKVVAHLFLEIVDIKASNLEPIKNVFIEDLCVDEAVRGQRIGKKLYEFALDYAKKLGCHNLTLDAWYDNAGAYRFYERLGMKPQKTRFEQRFDDKNLKLEEINTTAIRRATVDDIPAINNLLAQVLSVHHQARPDLFKPTGNKFSDEELALLLKDDEKPVFVYVHEGKVAAHLFLEIVDIKASNLEPIKNVFIEDLCVDGAVRGQRIGKKLYEFALDYAKKLGCHNLTLDAWYDNVGAYRFYERLGMKPQKTRFEQRFDDASLKLKEDNSSAIRRATVDDIPAINNLLAQVLSVHHQARPDLFKPTGNKFSDEELALLLKDDQKPVFVYVHEGKVAAHLFLEIVDIKASNLEPIKNVFIEDLCVDEAVRGQRIGKKLYEFALDYAKKLGCHNLTLDAWYDNVGAYRFYERLGMKPQKTRFEQRFDDKNLKLEEINTTAIRRATVDDIPAINNLLAQVLSVHHQARPDLFKPTGNKFSDEELALLLKDDQKPVFVYVHEGKVAAHLFLEIVDIKASNLEPIKNVFIEDLCVDEAVRGQRIGKKLYEFALDYAKKLECHNLTLDAWYDNVGAYRFYERLGMKPQKTRFEQRFN